MRLRKAATTVKVGDRIEARIVQRQRVVEVVQVINKRVGAPVAAECLVDHSPPVVREGRTPRSCNVTVARAGPTERDRRQIDRLRGG